MYEPVLLQLRIIWIHPADRCIEAGGRIVPPMRFHARQPLLEELRARFAGRNARRGGSAPRGERLRRLTTAGCLFVSLG